MQNLPDILNDAMQEKKGDKTSAWRTYYTLAKKLEKSVNGLTEQGKAYLSDGQDAGLKEAVASFDRLLALIKEQADVDSGLIIARNQQERRRQLQRDFFELDKHSGVPIGLTEQGRIAVSTYAFHNSQSNKQSENTTTGNPQA